MRGVCDQSAQWHSGSWNHWSWKIANAYQFPLSSKSYSFSPWPDFGMVFSWIKIGLIGKQVFILTYCWAEPIFPDRPFSGRLCIPVLDRRRNLRENVDSRLFYAGSTEWKWSQLVHLQFKKRVFLEIMLSWTTCDSWGSVFVTHLTYTWLAVLFNWNYVYHDLILLWSSSSM